MFVINLMALLSEQKVVACDHFDCDLGIWNVLFLKAKKNNYRVEKHRFLE